MSSSNVKNKLAGSRKLALAIACAATLGGTTATAQTLTSNSVGTHNGFYYSFWKDSGSASMTLHSGGRYASQWSNNTNNWVGGKGWNPGGPKTVSYSGYYGVNNSQNSYLALYGWTRNPLIEYYVIESYGSYNPSSCYQGRSTHGSFQSDGATYDIVRCQRVNQPSIDGTQTFYQYFSVRNPKKGFGNISGTITAANHFNAWSRAGLRLGNHNYMVLATEGYQSSGSSDITVSEGYSGGSTSSSGGSTSSSGGSTSSSSGGGSSSSSGGGGSNTIVVRARGTTGGESISLRINNNTVATWTLSTGMNNYTHQTNTRGDLLVAYTNDGGNRDVQIDYLQVNGQVRQAEQQSYNTGNYANGRCGGAGYSEWMHCNGGLGFGSF